MKGRILIGLSLLVIVIALIIAGKQESPFGNRNSSFSLDWTNEITSISISSKDKEVKLSKVDELWIVNNEMGARKSAISFILKTLEKLEIKSPVSDYLFQSLVGDEDIDPVIISINGKAGKRTSFLIYKSTDPSKGSILKKDKKSKPFFVTLPGYDTDPGRHFVADEKFWKPYHIFNLHPERISSINMSFLDEQMEDIEIIVNTDSVHLKVGNNVVRDVATDNLERYLSYFTFVPFETWEFGLSEADKNIILAKNPEIEIRVKTSDEEKIELRVWQREMIGVNGLEPDTDRLYGELNRSGEIFVVKYFDLDPLIKTKEYFITH